MTDSFFFGAIAFVLVGYAMAYGGAFSNFTKTG